MEPTPEEKKRVKQLIRVLRKEYPEARCSLEHTNALELLVAVLQAYVFAILTCIYLNDAIHPGH